MRHDFARVLREDDEQPVLRRREVDFGVVDEDLPAGEVDLESADLEDRGRLGRAVRGGVPEGHPDPRVSSPIPNGFVR